MDPIKPTEVDISDFFKKELGKEGNWETCSSCRNTSLSPSDMVKFLSINSGKKTPADYQIEFLEQTRACINKTAGMPLF